MVNKAGLRTVPVASAAVAVVAVALVMPLVGAQLWSGFRIAQSDEVLSVIAASERPLSVRNPGGIWAALLALMWFAVAYWRRSMTLWEAALVVIGGSLALARLGNAWLYGLTMIVPLARQLSLLRVRRPLTAVLIVVSLAVGGYTLMVTRPPAIPTEAAAAVISAQHNVVFADWRWAPNLQRALGTDGRVLAAKGLASETSDFWVDYVRITQGHERWAEALKRMGVDVVVLDERQSRPAAELVRASPEWRVMYDADGVVVAERSAS